MAPKHKQHAAAHKRTLDRLNDAVSSCNLKEFTSENVLGAFREEGIRSLEDLAKRVVATMCAPDARPQRVDLEKITRPTPARVLAKTVHRPPQVPFFVNGVQYEPADIRRFNGRALHMITTQRRGSLELIAFEEHSTLKRIAELLYTAGILGLGLKPADTGGTSGDIDIQFEPPSVAPPPPDGLEPPNQTQGSSGNASWYDPRVLSMYEHISPNVFGDVLKLGPMLLFSDLTSVGRGILGLGDWNDIISGLWCTMSHVICWEHIHHQGSALITGRTVYAGKHDNLEPYGWNDRISSVFNCG